jgi:serine/threonine protein kinase
VYEEMERLQALPDAADYFNFAPRRFVGTARYSLQQIPPSEALKHWDLWVGQALAALGKLHDAGFLHGSLDSSALIINEDGNLRLGGLQKIGESRQEEPFNPNSIVLPPEQLLHAAFQQTIPFQTAFQALQQGNWPMDQIATIFPTIQFTRPNLFGLYEVIQSEATYRRMGEAGDVWMLGWTLLSKYYSILEWPYAASSEFYQTRHEAFHDLIERMVRWNPSERIGVEEALREWAPQEFSGSAISEVPNTTVVTSVISEPAVVVAAELQPRGVGGGKRRPYLTLQSHPAGRNKTRRNLRNSNSCFATYNSELPKQD